MNKNIRTGIITKSFAVAVLIILPFAGNAQSEAVQTLPQFLFPKFAKGIVKMKDGRKLTAVLNYNLIDEEMIFQQGNRYMVLNKPGEIDTVYLQNRRFVNTGKAFYEVAAGGATPFYIQHKAKYVESGMTTAYGIKSPTAATFNVNAVEGSGQIRHIEMPDKVKVVPSPVNWVMINGKMEKFSAERQLLKLFPDREAELKEFLQKTGADIKTPEGLIQVGNFINGLR